VFADLNFSSGTLEYELWIARDAANSTTGFVYVTQKWIRSTATGVYGAGVSVANLFTGVQGTVVVTTTQNVANNIARGPIMLESYDTGDL
jgi:hypothetical protein